MATSAGDVRAYRLTAIDMLRGLAIVAMALDHVRDFFLVGAVQDPMGDPNVPPALFATRWITHSTGYGVSLPGVYAAWALVIVLLYPFCRRVAAVKARRRDWWLSYL